jgi:uncharacterized protein YcaQ
VTVHELSRVDARRIAVRAQLLDSMRPAGLLDVVRQSTGWTSNRNVSKLLEFMVVRGEVAIAGRSGGDRLWDLAERVYPDDPVVPVAEALRIRNGGARPGA